MPDRITQCISIIEKSALLGGLPYTQTSYFSDLQIFNVVKKLHFSVISDIHFFIPFGHEIASLSCLPHKKVPPDRPLTVKKSPLE